MMKRLVVGTRGLGLVDGSFGGNGEGERDLLGGDVDV